MARERIDDIVSQQAIEQLVALVQQLANVKNQMNDLIVDVAKFSAELQGVGSVRDMGAAVNNLNDATTKLNTANKTRLDIEREIKREGAEMAKAVQDEAAYFAKMDEIMRKYLKTQKATQQSIFEIQKALESNKIALKNLDESLKKGTISEEQYINRKAALIETQQKLKSELSEEQKQLKYINADLNAQAGSYESLNAQLGQLRAVWKSLSEAERENADVGGVLQAEINRLDEILKGLDKSIGNNQRNVGNYEIASKSAVKELKFLREEFANLTDEEKENESIGGALQVRMQELEEEISNSEAMTQKFASTFNSLTRSTLGKAGVVLNKLNGITAQTAVSFGRTAVNAVKAFGKQLLSLLANPIVAIIGAIALAVMQVVKAFQRNEELMNRLKVVGAALKPILDGIGKAFGWIAGGITTAVEWMTKWITVNNEAVKVEKRRQALEKKEQNQGLFNAKKQGEIQKLKNQLEDINLTYEDREKIYGNIRKLEKDMESENLTILNEKIKLKKKENEQDAESLQELMELEQEYQEAQNAAQESAREFREERRQRAEEHTQEIDRVRKENQEKAENARKESERKKKELEELKAKLEEERRLQIEHKKQLNREIEDLEIELMEKTEEMENQRHDLSLFRLQQERDGLKQQAKDAEERLLIQEKYDKRIEQEKQKHEINLKAIRDNALNDEYNQLEYAYQLEAARLRNGESSFKDMYNLEKFYIESSLALNEWALKQKLIDENTYLLNKKRLTAEEKEFDKDVAINKAHAAQDIIGSITDVMMAGAAQIEDEKKRVKIEQAITMAKVLLTESLAIAQAVLTQTQGDPYSFIPRVIASVATITGTFITAISAITKAQNAYAEGTDYHSGGSALVGEGTKNGRWQSEIVETPDGRRFVVSKPTYFENLPAGTKVQPIDQYGGVADMRETNAILERIANKGQVVINVDDKITNYIATKSGRMRVLNAKFKF